MWLRGPCRTIHGVTRPALIDLLVLGRQLDPARREGLLEDLTDLVERHLDSAGADLIPARAWAFAREVDEGAAFASGRPMAQPHYRLHVSLPAPCHEAAVHEELAAALARRVLRTERAYPGPEDLPRVDVTFGA